MNSNTYYPPSIPVSKSKTTTSQLTSIASIFFFSSIICTQLLLLKILFYSCLQFFHPYILVSFSLNMSYCELKSDLEDKKSESSNFLLNLLLGMLMLLSSFSSL